MQALKPMPCSRYPTDPPTWELGSSMDMAADGRSTVHRAGLGQVVELNGDLHSGGELLGSPDSFGRGRQSQRDEKAGDRTLVEPLRRL